MPIRVELRTERGDRVADLPDPNGGSFDAAGDFDALLPNADGILRYVDPYGDTMFNRLQAIELLEEIQQLGGRGDPTPVEQRGLARLKVMAERCRDTPHLYLWFVGD